MSEMSTQSIVADYVVFIPGMLCDARLFTRMTDTLEIGHHVASISGANSIDVLAQRILDEAPPKFALVGLSMGGIIALHIMRVAPERVSHLMLMSTTSDAEINREGASVLSQLAGQMASGNGQQIVDTVRKFYLGGNSDGADELTDLMFSMAESVGVEGLVGQATALQGRVDSNDVLTTINVPTTVLCGDQDRLCNLTGHEKMSAAVAQSRLVIIEGCGHMSAIEEPDVACAEMLALLAR